MGFPRAMSCAVEESASGTTSTELQDGSQQLVRGQTNSTGVAYRDALIDHLFITSTEPASATRRPYLARESADSAL